MYYRRFVFKRMRFGKIAATCQMAASEMLHTPPRDSDNNPWVKNGATGVVTAIDITHDPSKGCYAIKLFKH